MGKSKFYNYAYLYLAAGLIIVFWGFSKSYFGKLEEMAFPYHLHGISATLWMLLLVVQPFLYSKGKLKIHRYLGWTSIVLVPLIVFGGYEMMKLMIHNQEYYPPDTVYKLAFIDAVTLIGFSVLYICAIYFRKNLKLHARFMVSTIFGPLNPALTRVFFILNIAHSFDQSLTITYIILEIVLLIIILRERKHKEVWFTYIPVFFFTLIQHILIYFANDWDWWVQVMNSIADYS